MALTPEFISAVSARNLLRVRIMLKDSLLVDKNFNQFNEMRRYAESRSVDFWMEKSEEIEMLPKTEWTADLMNLELTKLVNDFTKERLVYCQSIIEKIYGINTYPIQQYGQNSSCSNSQNVQQSSTNLFKQESNVIVSGNSSDYDEILRSFKKIKRILGRNQSPEGDRVWDYDDIESIQVAAKKISRACENIKMRRK